MQNNYNKPFHVQNCSQIWSLCTLHCLIGYLNTGHPIEIHLSIYSYVKMHTKVLVMLPQISGSALKFQLCT